MPSAPRAFTERMTGVGGGSIRENVSSQPAGFLASSSRRSRCMNCDHVVAAGDRLHLVHPLQGDLRRHAEDGGDGGRRWRRSPCWPGRAAGGGSASAEPCGSSTWSPDSAQVGVGTAEAALAAEPVVAGALHHTAAGRAGPGVVLPHLAGRHPHHVRRGGGGPHDQRVVGVGDHDGLGAGQALAPLLGQHPGLGGPVELVAGEVEQRDALGVGVAGDTGEVLLVDLDDAEAWRPSRRPAPR